MVDTVLRQPITDENVWRPHSGQQTRFLQSAAFEALFGGAAGPGKTDCLLMESLRQIGHPRYNGILFRRTFNRLEGADGLIARSERWFPGFGGRYNNQKHVWRFPSGARIYFGHMEHEDDKQLYQGWQLAFVGFDELTEFLESQYLYLFTRCRVPAGSGLRPYVRSATNPGNLGHEWVKRRFVITDIINRMRWFARIDEKDTAVERDYPDAASRAFFPAKLRDNPNADPGYRARILLNPDKVERARLLDGDWDIIDTSDRVYPDWSFENISTEAAYDPKKGPVYWGADDGYAHGGGPGTASYHPRVILLAQRNHMGGLDIFAEYVKTLVATHEETVKEVLSWDYPKPEAAYLDSSAPMFGAVMWNIFSIYAIGVTHPVADGIKNVRRFIRDGNGVRSLRVHPNCEVTIREVAGLRYADNSQSAKAGERVPLKVDDHAGGDSLRYILWPLRSII